MAIYSNGDGENGHVLGNHDADVATVTEVVVSLSAGASAGMAANEVNKRTAEVAAAGAEGGGGGRGRGVGLGVGVEVVMGARSMSSFLGGEAAANPVYSSP